MNQFFCFGALTRDPQLKFIGAKNTALCEFGVAVESNPFGDRKETAFIDCKAWGKMAEACNDALRKGHRVAIQGRFVFESWDDKNTGQKRSKLALTVEKIMFGRAGGDGESRRESPKPGTQAELPIGDSEALGNL